MSISSSDLRQFPNLVHLGLRENLLQTLPGDLFIYTPMLRDADFTENRITSVGPNFLEPVKYLSLIHFIGNFCTQTTVRNNPNALLSLRYELEGNCATESMKLEKQFFTFAKEIQEFVVSSIGQMELNLARKLEDLARDVNETLREFKIDVNAALADQKASFNGDLNSIQNQTNEVSRRLTDVEQIIGNLVRPHDDE